jgi:hypothetical protein
VDDDVHALEGVVELLLLPDVADDKAGTAGAGICDVVRRADTEVVERDDIGIEPDELVDDVAADESGAACDDDLFASELHRLRFG